MIKHLAIYIGGFRTWFGDIPDIKRAIWEFQGVIGVQLECNTYLIKHYLEPLRMFCQHVKKGLHDGY